MTNTTAGFEASVLLPALQEIAGSPALNREYAAEVVTARPHPKPEIEELIQTLASTMRREHGPSLVLSNRERPQGILPIGGHYVMTPFYSGGADPCASPAVIFWMRFNNKLHVFNHRYDNNIAQHSLSEITRPHVLNHVLVSFDFYKIYAFSDQPFPGYR